jgi:hypothetical protein
LRGGGSLITSSRRFAGTTTLRLTRNRQPFFVLSLMLRFIGIGAQKSGTTWLYAMLAHHPHVDFPGRREDALWGIAEMPGMRAPGQKEHHFWNRAILSNQGLVPAYLARFSDPSKVQGELTPAYALLPPERIAALHAVAPSVRLLYLMRNPIERAWSSALMALDRAELAIDEVSDQWFIDHFRSRGSLARGDYETTLRTWCAVFPSDQLFVGLYEQIVRDPRTLLSDVACHIGVDPEPLQSLPDAVLTARVFAGPQHALPDRLRAVLQALYRPRIASLSSYLDRPLAWD